MVAALPEEEMIVEVGDDDPGNIRGEDKGGGPVGPIARLGRALGNSPLFFPRAGRGGGAGPNGDEDGPIAVGLTGDDGPSLRVPGAEAPLAEALTTVTGSGPSKSTPRGTHRNVGVRPRMPIIYEPGLTDSNADPGAILKLLERVAKDTGLKVTAKEEFVPLELTEIEDSPVAYFVGHSSFRFNNRHRETLRACWRIPDTALQREDLTPSRHRSRVRDPDEGARRAVSGIP